MFRVAILMLLLALLVAGCGNGVERDESGAIVGEGALSPFELEVGDCFNDPEGGEELIDRVAAVPCSAPHDNEVFHLADYPAGAEAPFPGQEELDRFAAQQCEAAFGSYVGVAYASSRFVMAPVQPTEESWAEGDRELICILFDPDLNKLEGSRRGANE